MPLVTTVPLRMSTKVSGRTRVWKNSRVLDLLLLVLKEEINCFLGANEPWCHPDATKYQESMNRWPKEACVSPQSERWCVSQSGS